MAIISGNELVERETLKYKWAAQILAALNVNNYSKIPQEQLAKTALKGANALIKEINNEYLNKKL